MKNIIFILIVLFSVSWRQYPEGRVVQITFEHQIFSQMDTIMVYHYHRVDSKFYVITLDKREIWCDNVIELNIKN
jgi:hypothetical protein